MISINNLTVAYGGFTLLNEINFHISESDKIGLVGKNGAGKSTLLNMIGGLDSFNGGAIIADRITGNGNSYMLTFGKFNKIRKPPVFTFTFPTPDPDPDPDPAY